MVEHHEAQLNLTYAALADPTRRAILARLMQEDARVTELAEPFEMSLNAVSKHLRVLEQAGLVRREVKGRDHFLSLNPKPLKQATMWLESYRMFWEERVDALESFLRQKKKSKRKSL